MLNPIERFKSSILHLNRDWNHSSVLLSLEGYDTTASSIAFCIYNLALNPEYQEKLYEVSCLTHLCICMVGSYTSLSVCPFTACEYTKIPIIQSVLRAVFCQLNTQGMITCHGISALFNVKLHLSK